MFLSQEASDQLIAADLFSGSGAVTSVLKHSGFNVVIAVDNDATACETDRLNHSEVSLYEGDICKLRADKLSIPSGVDLLVVCARCQPFSSQNRKRGEDSRVVSPSKSEKMNPLRIKGGENLTFLTMKLNLKALRDHQRKGYGLQKDSEDFKPTPPGFNAADIKVRIQLGGAGAV